MGPTGTYCNYNTTPSPYKIGEARRSRPLSHRGKPHRLGEGADASTVFNTASHPFIQSLHVDSFPFLTLLRPVLVHWFVAERRPGIIHHCHLHF